MRSALASRGIASHGIPRFRNALSWSCGSGDSLPFVGERYLQRTSAGYMQPRPAAQLVIKSYERHTATRKAKYDTAKFELGDVWSLSTF
jgi:hypothetical protein